MSDLTAFMDIVGGAFDSSDDARNGASDAPEPALVAPVDKLAAGAVSAWAVNDGRYWGISHSLPVVAAGVYTLGHSDNIGVFLQQTPLQTDAIIDFPDSKSEQVVADITHFTTLKSEFVKRGLLYKRGVLLWGPPGSGKTSTLHLLMRLIVDRLGGIALIAQHPSLVAAALQLIRKIEPQRQVIVILEDMDALVRTYGESQFLALLDGESQVDNVVFVATTNYPERLDRRFVDRPSRFDTVEYVGMPSEAARRVYLQHKEPGLSEADLTEMVAATEGLSIAHLREMIILTQCFGRSIAAAAERLSAFKHRTPDSERAPGRADAGFGVVPDSDWSRRNARARQALTAAAGATVRR